MIAPIAWSRRLPHTLLSMLEPASCPSCSPDERAMPVRNGAEQQLTDVTMRCSRCTVVLCPVQVPEENHHDKATSSI